MLVCVSCESPDIEPVDFYGPTGVTAPDGGMEMAGGTLWRCGACGGMADETTELPDEPAGFAEAYSESLRCQAVAA